MYEKNRNRRTEEFQDLDYICCSTYEIITVDVYADNRCIIADGVPEIEAYRKEVLSNPEETEIFKKELLEIVVDVTEFLSDAV